MRMITDRVKPWWGHYVHFLHCLAGHNVEVHSQHHSDIDPSYCTPDTDNIHLFVWNQLLQTDWVKVSTFTSHSTQKNTLLWRRPSQPITKVPLRAREYRPHLIHGFMGPPKSTYMVPWAHPSPHPKRHLDRFSCFCRAHDHDRPRYSICSNRPHLCSTAIRPKLNKIYKIAAKY